MKFSKMIRVLSLALALLMLCLCFAACADDPVTPDDPSKPTEDPEKPTDERILPDIPLTGDYGDQEITFLYWYVEAWVDTVRYCRDIIAEDYGDKVSNAVFNRNAKIEENYNVVIGREMMVQSGVPQAVLNMNSTGDDTYQVVVPRLLEQSAMVTNGYFYNLYDIEHIDLDKPWWDADSINQLSTNNVLYLVSSSLLVNDKDATAALAFNKDALKDHPSWGNFYEMVADNEWTYEAVADIAADAMEDLDGNQTMDESDFWGFLGKNDVQTSFFHGSGGRFFTIEDNQFVLSFGQNDNDIPASDEILEFMRSEWFYNHHTTGIGDSEYTKLFENGHGLFFWMRLDEVTNMRGSQVEFGILPIPKFTEEQENYYSTVSQHTTGLISIPLANTGDLLDLTGLILEALSAESHYTLQPAYIDDSLKTRYARDEESKEMLTIILGSRVFDPGCIFGFGKFADTYQNLVKNSSSTAATFLAQNEEKAISDVEDFNEIIASH